VSKQTSSRCRKRVRQAARDKSSGYLVPGWAASGI
jgi:hypothetical protein